VKDEKRTTEPGRGAEPQPRTGELPADLAATGSTNDVPAEPVEAEVGGEGVAEVVHERDDLDEETERQREAA
jgi:hypothetical protein